MRSAKTEYRVAEGEQTETVMVRVKKKGQIMRDLNNQGVTKFKAGLAVKGPRRRLSLSLVQFSSVAQSCSTLCDPMDCSMPGFPVHHQLLELAQTHVHLVGDAIQPSHPLSPPSSPAFNLSQHQGIF